MRKRSACGELEAQRPERAQLSSARRAIRHFLTIGASLRTRLSGLTMSQPER